MNLNRRMALAAFSGVLLFLSAGLDRASAATTQSGTFVSFDVPGATTTSPRGINNAGVVVGSYGDANGDHGFFRTAAGAFRTFDIASATQTWPVAINNSSVITGSYTDASGANHGFILTPGQPVVTFDAIPNPGSMQGTRPTSINSSGAVAGSYLDNNMVNHGFARQTDGAIVTFDAPGASSVPLDGTLVLGISDTGVVAGYYIDTASVFHGFAGIPPKISPINIPGAGDTVFLGTRLMAISSTNSVTGFYYGSTTGAAFVLNGADVTRFGVGAIISPISINSAGAVTGTFQTSGVTYGFLRLPAGTITRLDDPNAANGTFPESISGNGVIAGYYIDASFLSHGFIYTP